MRLVLVNADNLLMAEASPGDRVAGEQMAEVPSVPNGWLAIEDGKIAGFGKGAYLPRSGEEAHFLQVGSVSDW